MRPASMVATAFLALIATAHLLRLLFDVPVIVGGRVVPMWMSGAAALLTGALAIALGRENRHQVKGGGNP